MTMKNFFYGLTTIALIVVLGACTTSQPSFKQATGARADLSKANFRMLKSGAMGESTGFTFLFFSLAAPTAAEAKRKMYEQLKAEGIELEGKAIALTNVTEDRGGVNLLIFGVPTITITADVIEYIK